MLRASTHGYSAKRCAEHVLDMTISHSEIVVIVMSNILQVILKIEWPMIIPLQKYVRKIM